MAKHKKPDNDNIPATSTGRGGKHRDNDAKEVELKKSDGSPSDLGKFPNQAALDAYMVRTGKVYKGYEDV